MDIHSLLHTVVFSKNQEEKQTAVSAIRKHAQEKGITLSSTHNLYQAIGQEKVSGFTVPALNLRTLSYDIARIVFQLMKEQQIGIVIFEIARSEMAYTNQQPEEYAACIISAALQEGYTGPIFLQADHVQVQRSIYETRPDEEIETLKKLIGRSIKAGFFNVDIDASTLVDLSNPDINEQQKNNYQTTALLTKYIRQIQPQDITISIGGEIGHIGDKNSTVEEFETFMNGYIPLIQTEGISKVSVQTGTSHGGHVLPNGSLEKVQVDFSVLQKIGETARKKYGLGGAVQHGASTLPLDEFKEFVTAKTLEIHLSTEFQNIVYNTIPFELKEKMYGWVKDNCTEAWEKDTTEEQFLYKNRKKALGVFKQQLWSLSDDTKKPILQEIKNYLSTLFNNLHITNTTPLLFPYL